MNEEIDLRNLGGCRDVFCQISEKSELVEILSSKENIAPKYSKLEEIGPSAGHLHLDVP